MGSFEDGSWRGERERGKKEEEEEVLKAASLSNISILGRLSRARSYSAETFA
jgi:hypothetical protein